MKKFIKLLLPALLLALLSGCFLQAADELYTLPRQTEQYYNLQAELDGLLSAGASYSAPVSGDNRQAIQMADLTGDGQNEVIVFLNTGGDKPLKIYLYRLNEDRYELLTTLERDGSAFDRVDYAQIDGEDGLELVVGTRVSNQVLRAVSVYAADETGAAELMSAGYVKYTVADLNGDAKYDLLTFRSGEEGQNGQAELFCCTDGPLHSEGTASMTTPLEQGSIVRIMAGFSQENIRAVFVASAFEQEGLVTDVFALRNSAFVNIALPEKPEQGVVTSRNREIYGADIDDDGLIELPSPMRLQNLNPEDTTAYDLINWYNLRLDGQKVVKLTTYYNTADGWYLTIPDAWQNSLLVSYEPDGQGDTGCSFYRYDTLPEKAEKIATVYVFTGTNAQKKAEENDRFVLGRKGDVIYAARLEPRAAMEQEEFTGLFRLIQTQWDSGQMREVEIQ